MRPPVLHADAQRLALRRRRFSRSFHEGSSLRRNHAPRPPHLHAPLPERAAGPSRRPRRGSGADPGRSCGVSGTARQRSRRESARLPQVHGLSGTRLRNAQPSGARSRGGAVVTSTDVTSGGRATWHADSDAQSKARADRRFRTQAKVSRRGDPCPVRRGRPSLVVRAPPGSAARVRRPRCSARRRAGRPPPPWS